MPDASKILLTPTGIEHGKTTTHQRSYYLSGTQVRSLGDPWLSTVTAQEREAIIGARIERAGHATRQLARTERVQGVSSLLGLGQDRVVVFTEEVSAACP